MESIHLSHHLSVFLAVALFSALLYIWKFDSSHREVYNEATSAHCDATSNCYIPTSWKALPDKRLLIVQFVSAGYLGEFNRFWRSHELKFHSMLKNKSVLLTFPQPDLQDVISGVAVRQNWKFKGNYSHEHAFAFGPLMQFITPFNTEVFLQAMLLGLPQYYMTNPVVPYCHGKRRSLSYSLYSGAVFSYQILHLPAISKYQFFLKVDSDIQFKKNFPIDIGLDMATNGCIIGHSKLQNSTDCEKDALRALLNATEELQLQKPRSAEYEWCNEGGDNLKPSKIFYGNFVGFATRFLRHPDVLRLSTYMYESWEDGYFKRRWGDQGPFIMYACYFLDIPDILNPPVNTICDYSRFRNKIFFHR